MNIDDFLESDYCLLMFDSLCYLLSSHQGSVNNILYMKKSLFFCDVSPYLLQ